MAASWNTLLAVALGGALGSVLRYVAIIAVARRFGEQFPWGTLLVNVIGSFVIGILAALTVSGSRLSDSAGAQRFLIPGLCGGFTTFSTFSIQTFDLLRAGNWMGAAMNSAASVLLCLFAVAVGFWCGKLLAGR